MAEIKATVLFNSRARTKKVINAQSTSPCTAALVSSFVGVKETLSGAMTANVFKVALSIPSACTIHYLSVKLNTGAGSRTIRIRVTIDGDTDYAFDSITNANVSTSGQGITVVGTASSSTTVPVAGKIIANQSAVVEIAASVSETDLLTIGYLYEVEEL